MQQPLVCFHIQVVITFLNEIFTAEVSVPYLAGGSPLNLCFKRKCKNKYLKISVWEISLFAYQPISACGPWNRAWESQWEHFWVEVVVVWLTSFLCLWHALPCICSCSQWGFLHTAALSSFNPTGLFPSTHTHTHVSTHVSTRTHTTSAQVAASAARTADAALIIGCDRRADFISKQSPARERKLTRFGLTLKSSAVFLCNTVLFLGLTWEQRSSQFISGGKTALN